MFIKYMHLERLGTEAVEGIEIGHTYVFPKLDGTNGSVWYDNGYIKAGSRNRVLSTENDNAGFYNAILKDERYNKFFEVYPHLTLYGEWLVPHSLQTYQDDAWRKFYVFDVYNRETEQHLHYDNWSLAAKYFGLDYLPPIAILKNPSHDDLQKCLEKNIFLIKDGQGIGEGVVIKNYDFTNKFGNVVWAKLITNAFKMVHHQEMGAPLVGGELVEEKIVNEYVTQHLVDKVYAKIINDHGGWSSKYIPMLLGVTFHDLITEEMWDILKKHNKPRIDFKFLERLTIAKIKELRTDVF